MKNPIIKSNIRRPIKIILLFLILSIVSSLFISSLTQYFIVNREIGRIGSYYNSIGTIQPIDKENYYVNEAQKIIADDALINYEDIRRYSFGKIEGLYNPAISQHEDLYYDTYDDYKVFLGDVIFIAEVIRVYQAPSAKDIYEGLGINVKVKELIAGFPDYLEYIGLAVAANSLVTGEKIEYINNDVIDDLLSLEIGSVYLFRGYYDSKLKYFTMIKPLYSDGPLYEKLDDNGYIDWKSPKFSMIKEDVDVLNEKTQSYTIIGTKDMSTMPATQENMDTYYLRDGRWINYEDHRNRNYVCVINEDLAKLRNIEIGDNLEIEIKDTERGSPYLLSDKDRREWKSYNTTEPISFEVVGIFGFTHARRSTTRGRDIYIPDSTLPEEFGNYYTQGIHDFDIYPNNYSFILESTEDEPAFIEKYESALYDMGYKLYFVENNAESFWNSAKPIRHSILISSILFTLILLLTLYFVVYIYVEGHKLNYAIERALGIPKRKCLIHLILPLLISGAIASMVGGFLGYNNAMDKSEELLSSIGDITQTIVETGLSIQYFFLFIIVVNTLFISIVYLRLIKLKKIPIISLINNHNRKKIKDKNCLEEGTVEISSIKKVEINEKTTKESSKAVLSAYSLKHCIRSIVPSISMILFAGIFIFSLLWMNYLIIRNNDLINKAYDESIVMGNIITVEDGLVYGTKRGAISGTHIENLMETDLVRDYTALAEMHYDDLYVKRNGIEEKYEMSEEDRNAYHIGKPSYKIIASNQPFNGESEIKLTESNIIEGYSLEDFYRSYQLDDENQMIIDENGHEEIPVLVSNEAMKEYQLELGNKISLVPEGREAIKAFGTIIGTFSQLDLGRTPYGFHVYNRESELFVYPLSALQVIEKTGVYYELLEFEFKPEKNRELLNKKEELKDMVARNTRDDQKNELRLLDGELVNVVEPLERNLSLLEILYPITFILAVILAGILSFMMVFRRSIDIAILRILGVKSKEVRWNLFRENMVLVTIGILLACGLIIGITTNTYPIGMDKYIIVIGGYLLGTVVGLILGIGKVTNKKPLDMLQVKE